MVLAELRDQTATDIFSTPEWLQPSSEHTFPILRGVNARSFVEEINYLYAPDQLYSLATMPDRAWNSLLMHGGVHSLYVIGIHTPSEAAQQDSIQYLPLYRQQLSDPSLSESDVVASPFALINDELNSKIAANWNEWDEMLHRLEQRGVKIFIDFIPNHVALDNPWRETHPEYFIDVSPEIAAQKPGNYFEFTDSKGNVHFYARGKHYQSNGKEEVWTDTLQLNYSHKELREAMNQRLQNLVPHAHGVRVDTAILPDYHVFKETWGDIIQDMGEPWDFWGDVIAAAKNTATAAGKEFTFIGETYEHPEVLQRFDMIYGSAMYGDFVALSHGFGSIGELKRNVWDVYVHQEHTPQYVSFITNHDLASTVEKFGNVDRTLAYATITAFLPGTWMIHQGEEHVRKNPPMQVIKPYLDPLSVEISTYVHQEYNLLVDLHNSIVVQQGTPSYIETHSDIIAQKFEREEQSQKQGIIVCTNAGENYTIAQIPLPHGVDKQNVQVLDLQSQKMIAHEIITDPKQNSDTMSILLGGYGRQVILYTI